jgi:hypothetical protein
MRLLGGLAYSLMVVKREKGSKASAKISRQILHVLEAQADDFENRSKATV